MKKRKKNIKNKNIIYITVGITVVLLIAGVYFLNFRNFVGDETNNKYADDNLDRYRSDDIPEECQLPPYENNTEKWKEHLSHHENTLYCLNYYNRG